MIPIFLNGTPHAGPSPAPCLTFSLGFQSNIWIILLFLLGETAELKGHGDDPVWNGKGFHEHQSCQFLRQDWSSDIKKDYYNLLYTYIYMYLLFTDLYFKYITLNVKGGIMCAKGMRRMESGQASSKTINWYVYWWLLWCLAALAGFLPFMAAQSATLVAGKARCMYRSEFSCIQMYFFNLGCLKQWVEQIMTPNDPQGFCESECYANALGILTLAYFGRRGVPKYVWETPSPQSSWPIHQRGTVVVPIRKFGLCFWFFYTSVQSLRFCVSDLELWDQLNPKETGSIWVSTRSDASNKGLSNPAAFELEPKSSQETK